jgi:hypothetical protein
MDFYAKPWGAKESKITETGNKFNLGVEPPNTFDMPLYEAPEVTKAPIYSASRWDESAIDALAQKRAASGIRNLRDQVQRVTGRTFGNPQVTRMTLREALQGYGSGLDKVMSGANEAASSEYARQYGYKADASKTSFSGKMEAWRAENKGLQDEANMNYKAKVNTAETKFNSLWDKWKAINTGTRTETVTY